MHPPCAVELNSTSHGCAAVDGEPGASRSAEKGVFIQGYRDADVTWRRRQYRRGGEWDATMGHSGVSVYPPLPRRNAAPQARLCDGCHLSPVTFDLIPRGRRVTSPVRARTYTLIPIPRSGTLITYPPNTHTSIHDTSRAIARTKENTEHMLTEPPWRGWPQAEERRARGGACHPNKQQGG